MLHKQFPYIIYTTYQNNLLLLFSDHSLKPYINNVKLHLYTVTMSTYHLFCFNINFLRDIDGKRIKIQNVTVINKTTTKSKLRRSG